MLPEFPQDIGARKKISGHSDRALAQNFDAVLAVIVILAGEAIFVKNDWKCRKHIKLHNSAKSQNWHVPKIREGALFAGKDCPPGQVANPNTSH